MLIALGFGDDRTAAWISRDGVDWGRPAAMPPLDLTNVVAGSADQVVVIGRERTLDGSGPSLLLRASLGDWAFGALASPSTASRACITNQPNASLSPPDADSMPAVP